MSLLRKRKKKIMTFRNAFDRDTRSSFLSLYKINKYTILLKPQRNLFNKSTEEVFYILDKSTPQMSMRLAKINYKSL